MLVLTRRPGQAIMIGEVEVYVAEVKGDQVRLSINAPRDVTILRSEVLEAVQQENAAAAMIDSRALEAFSTLAAAPVPLRPLTNTAVTTSSHKKA